VLRFVVSILSVLLLPCLAGCGENGRLIKRVDILEQDLSDLHQANRKIEKRLDDVQIQLKRITKKLLVEKKRASQGKLKARVGLSSGKAVKLAPTDRETMDEGYDEESIARGFTRALSPFRSSHYVRAIETLTKFARDYVGHPLAVDALYYLGRAHLVRGEYHKAQVDFSAVSRQDPRNRLAPDAMLLAARCQEKLGRRKDARTIYLQLVQAFPLSEEAAEANRRLRYIR